MEELYHVIRMGPEEAQALEAALRVGILLCHLDTAERAFFRKREDALEAAMPGFMATQQILGVFAQVVILQQFMDESDDDVGVLCPTKEEFRILELNLENLNRPDIVGVGNTLDNAVAEYASLKKKFTEASLYTFTAQEIQTMTGSSGVN